MHKIDYKINHHYVVDQCGVEDIVFCEVNMWTLQHVTTARCTRTAKFAHMNGHWKAYDIIVWSTCNVWICFVWCWIDMTGVENSSEITSKLPFREKWV